MANLCCVPCALAQQWHVVTRRPFAPVFVGSAAAFTLIALVLFVLPASGIGLTAVGISLCVIAVVVQWVLGTFVTHRVRKTLRARYGIASNRAGM